MYDYSVLIFTYTKGTVMNLDYIVDSSDILETTIDIIAAYVTRNKVSVDDMCSSIGSVYKTLHSLGQNNRALTYRELLNGGEAASEAA